MYERHLINLHEVFDTLYNRLVDEEYLVPGDERDEHYAVRWQDGLAALRDGDGERALAILSGVASDMLQDRVVAASEPYGLAMVTAMSLLRLLVRNRDEVADGG